MSGGGAPGALGEAAARARGGDEAAFRALVERSYPTVFRLSAALLRDRDEAADAAQETFVRAWERVRELREPAAALGWLCAIARNVAHDRRRGWWRRGRAPAAELLPALEAADGPPSPDDALAARERERAVRRAVGGLGERHRVVLELREVEGMTYEEIAEALGVPIGTVESRLHRARLALARRLGPLAREEGR